MNKSEYPLSLRLPKGDSSLLTSAAEAVKQEYRNSVRWKRLRCRKVSRLTGQDEGIFVVEVGHAIDLDWTWEGAIAFRPIDVKNIQDDLDQIDKFLFSEESQRAGKLAQSMWSGEVVEIDETNGKIFVYISDHEHPPRVGTFFIRPFDFLFHLNNAFNSENFREIQDKLPDRLNACQGGIHPKTVHSSGYCLESLKELWSHSWEFLWGPPGTGKTTTIGKQVAACISEDFGRILVVSTTNRATDEVALAIGRERDEKSILVTTPHSFKGFEAEIVVVAGVDQFFAKGRGILSNTLYVAMTRARSILAVYGKQSTKGEITNLFTVFDRTLDLLLRRSTVQVELSPIDDFEEIASKIGKENRSWLEDLCHGVQIQQEPIIASDGEIVAEPLFWFRNGSQVVACFERDSTTTHIQHRIEDFGGRVIFPGDQIGLINCGTKLDGDIYPGFKSDVQIPQNNGTPSNPQVSTPKPVSPPVSQVKKTSSSPVFVVKSINGAWQVVNTKTGDIVSTTNIKDSAEKRARELNGQHVDNQAKNVYSVRTCSGGWQVVNSATGELILTTNVQQNALDRARKLNGN